MTAADTMAPTADATWRPRHNPWLIAAAVTLAAFMEILDTTIVNVALRYIAGDLGVSNDDATWVLTSYLVSNGILWLARRCTRPQTIFPDLHRHVHGLLAPLRDIHQSR